MRKRVVSTLLVALAVTVGGNAWAALPIPADSLAKQKVRIDGVLREWPGSATKLTTTLRGSPKARVSALVGYDDKSLYVAFDVRDAKFARSSAFGTNEDHGVLVLELPKGRGSFEKYNIAVYAGDSGKSAGQVKINGRRTKAEVVEAPNDGGYTVEAKIPWSAIPRASRVRVGMRAQFQYVDATAPGKVAGVLATKRVPLFIEAEQSLYQNLIEPKELDIEPDREAFGNVLGSSVQERVAIFGGYLTICGSDYKGGKQFYYKDLLMPDASLVTRFELADTDGDGKAEIILQRRTGQGSYREIFEILKVQSDGAAERVFAHEVAIVTREGKIENKVKLTPAGGRQQITISQGTYEGFDPDTFREPPHEGMESALLPWSTVGSRTIKWDGSEYAVEKETKQKPKMVAHASRGSRFTHGRPEPGGAAQPPPPRPPTASELLDKVYALYRKERGFEKREPRFDFVTDVAGNETLERVLVHDREILVFGPDFLGGTSYTYIGVGVASAKDVLDVTARDLTGDGKAEIIVRGVIHAKGGEELDDVDVRRSALFIYQVSGGGISRIFGAEIGRAIGDNRIIGGLAFRPAETGWSIELLPGHAVGWDKRTYPFESEEGRSGGLEALVLPWSRGSRTYTFSGTTYAPE